MAQVVVCLPIKCKAQSSNSNTGKPNKNKLFGYEDLFLYGLDIIMQSAPQ
jgi:hypothetical protein